LRLLHCSIIYLRLIPPSTYLGPIGPVFLYTARPLSHHPRSKCAMSINVKIDFRIIVHHDIPNTELTQSWSPYSEISATPDVHVHKELCYTVLRHRIFCSRYDFISEIVVDEKINEIDWNLGSFVLNT